MYSTFSFIGVEVPPRLEEATPRTLAATPFFFELREGFGFAVVVLPTALTATPFIFGCRFAIAFAFALGAAFLAPEMISFTLPISAIHVPSTKRP
jgi:hypothetical protein